MIRDRRCVIFLAFDLPTTEKELRREYRRFRKYLIKNGYIMMQESIYIKLLHYSMNAEAEIQSIKAHAPGGGNVIVFPMTMAQFRKIERINSEELDISWFSENFISI